MSLAVLRSPVFFTYANSKLVLNYTFDTLLRRPSPRLGYAVPQISCESRALMRQ